MTRPKPYQVATVESACRVLTDPHRLRPRFLVADEVGLGKTVVAQQIIRRMAQERGDRPLVVYYVCSSLTIAGQNSRKLVEAVVGDGGDVDTAVCRADRLSMLPFEEPPSHPKVHLYSLTPDTSLPNRKGKRRDGRKEERALLHQLLNRCWPELISEDSFRGQVSEDNWPGALAAAAARLEATKGRQGTVPLGKLTRRFQEQMRLQLSLGTGAHVPSAIRRTDNPLELVSLARTAMVGAVFELEGLQPDLVIFDEFQRFRDLVMADHGQLREDGKEMSELEGPAALDPARRLRGDETGRRVPLLLLSATPYSLYRQRDEGELFGDHHGEFLDLLCFLFGDGDGGEKAAKHARGLFGEFADQVRKPSLDFDRIENVKSEIEEHLGQVMSRTERARIAALNDGSPPPKKTPRAIQITTSKEDWQVFRQFHERLALEYRSAAVPYWRSIPLPLQSMGRGYVAWPKVPAKDPEAISKAPAFCKDRLVKQVSFEWPHPKLRALLKTLAPKTLTLPWMPPTLPWWRLADSWNTTRDIEGKLLLFSRLRATPKIVAAAINHEARAVATSIGSWSRASAHLPLRPSRMPVLACFYPCLWLAEACDPLAEALHPNRRRDFAGALREALVTRLERIGVEVVRHRGKKRPVWQLLAGIETSLGLRSGDTLADAKIAPEVVEAWRGAGTKRLAAISRSELDALAWHGLSAPGVVMARSLLRHFPALIDGASRVDLADFSMNAWRLYFDNPVFVAALRKRSKRRGEAKLPGYPRALQRAVVDGNLESVLDEHIWYQTQGTSMSVTDVMDGLRTVLGVKGGHVTIHDPKNPSKSFRAPCEVAMPFAQELARSSGSHEKPLRTEQIRAAFNSPFWPYVLTTTSVGQEGLDFHPWCKTLLHWDLPGNPVDLEQREGRIQRYAGLGVRQAIGREYEELEGIPRLGSPWKVLEKKVDAEIDPTESGLQPWWHYPGASVDARFFHIPASEELDDLARLKEQRAIYRLALGQQHQEDFVRMVSARDGKDLRRLSELTPDLSAWGRAKREDPSV
ncbi:hypothetical protein [Thioalkalivibrio sp. AKL8]|uniref:hypothetical protein n=1 Tax=Thioalkalivibrio sp. AKL8 TaxID=1158156 RepID=UPI00037B73FC|nr:hypothetical protein [Thioalkalivibrio sp. AKL8]